MTSVENSTESSILIPDLSAKEQDQRDRCIAGLIILAVGICGLLVDTWAIRVVWKCKALHNCFGNLMLLHAFTEALVLCCFVFWAVPITLFDTSLSKSTLGLKIGQIVTVFYYTTLYAQLFKAANRFCAIGSPINYRKWFSKKNSKIILSAVMLLSIFHGALYFFPGCNFYFDGDYFTWSYDETECYELMSFYVDFLIGCSIIGSAMLIDICTLFMVIKRGLFAGTDNGDVKFFMQTFTTSAVYTVVMIISQILCNLNDNKWYVFWTVTFTWEIWHVIDGVIMISFNLRQHKKTESSSTIISKIEGNETNEED